MKNTFNNMKRIRPMVRCSLCRQKLSRPLWILMFLLGGISLLSAQQIGVKGTVFDTYGSPLPGASIVEKGSSNGTQTDFDGNFQINVTDEDAVLIVSYLGFATKEVSVGGNTQISIILEESASGLDEVVVVGYGTQQKKDLTGAIGIAKGDVLQNRPINNVTEGLQGVIPGLTISPNSGAPGGGGVDINIRGATSINGGSPLVLVDGAQLPINSVNPEDIESVTVLKDAASAAIYGARAAFGVILITTKKGKKETKPQFTLSSSTYMATPTIIPEKSDSYKYALYVNSMRQSTNQSTIFNEEHLGLLQSRVSGAISDDYTLKPSGSAYYEHANTNWSDLVFSKAAPGQNHNIGVSGGSERSTYRASFAYSGNDGIVKIGGDKFSRYNLNLNLSTDLKDWLTTKFQVNLRRSNTNVHNLPPGSGASIFHVVWRARPTLTPTLDLDGVPYPTFIRLNPVETLRLGGRNVSDAYNVNAKAGIEMKFGDLKLFSNFTYNPGISKAVRNNVTFESTTPWANLNVRTDGGPSFVEKTHNINEYYAFDAYATYDKYWESGHKIGVTVGYNQEWNEFSTTRAYNTDLISFDVLSLSNTTGDPLVSDNITDWALRSGFARLNYSYKSKYLLTLNGRYDGSSRFNKNDRFGFFPSVSVGWKVSEENFLKDSEFISLLKLRGSYGKLGNQSTSALYPFEGYNTIGQVNWSFGGSRPLGIVPGNPLGDSRTWETITSTNFGLDISIFDGRLNSSLDVYRRTTQDMLVAGDALPAVYGAAAPQENAADLEVNGWEFSLGWKDRIGSDFGYDLNFVISDSKGTITRFDNPTKSLQRSFYKGQEIGEIWGFETQGLFQSQEEIAEAADHSPLGAGNQIAAGDVRYTDLNNDGQIDRGELTVDNPGDLKIIGNQSPRYLYGLRGAMDWKGIDFSFFLQGVGQKDFWLDGPIMFGGIGNYGNVVVTDELYNNTWSDGSDGLPVNTDAYYFRPSQQGVVSRNTQVQTRYLQDASYLRLKNLTLGYSLPSDILNKKGISNIRIYVSGENLFTSTKLNSNFDPELLSPGQANLGSASFSNGGDQSGKLYPLSRKLSLGLNIGF